MAVCARSTAPVREPACHIGSWLDLGDDPVLLGPFYGAIAVPSVTRCRYCCCCCGSGCTGGVRQ